MAPWLRLNAPLKASIKFNEEEAARWRRPRPLRSSITSSSFVLPGSPLFVSNRRRWAPKSRWLLTWAARRGRRPHSRGCCRWRRCCCCGCVAVMKTAFCEAALWEAVWHSRWSVDRVFFVFIYLFFSISTASNRNGGFELVFRWLNSECEDGQMSTANTRSHARWKAGSAFSGDFLLLRQSRDAAEWFSTREAAGSCLVAFASCS